MRYEDVNPDHVQTGPLLRGESQSVTLLMGPKILCLAKEVANRTLIVLVLPAGHRLNKGQGDSKPHNAFTTKS